MPSQLKPAKPGPKSGHFIGEMEQGTGRRRQRSDEIQFD